MAEEEEEEVKKPSTARKSSWTPESHDSYNHKKSRNPDRNDGRESRDGRDSRENENERKAISVIRINPNEMSRLRKDSEKYADNHSDNESYGSHSRSHRSRDNYGSRGGDGYRSRGGGRGDYRGRKTSYDPDYDRSVAYRRRDDNNQREVTIGGDRIGDRPRDNKYGNMSLLIKQLKRSYHNCSAPPSAHENRHKKECLALFREYTLNDPESILSSKLDPNSQEKIEAAVSINIF